MKKYNVIIHDYKRVKVNKCDSQYLINHELPDNSNLTERVKVEAFQGYSKAYNLAEYFRLRGETSWKGGKQITGLWKSDRENIYFGDYKKGNIKTLILFQFKENRKRLLVFVFPKGYYPQKSVINQITKDL
ncbi:MAG: hypothetical protein ACJARP_000004 [Vicingaceae bacterium]|jgi:hypothetical protein